jgi:hypothetical protein
MTSRLTSAQPRTAYLVPGEGLGAVEGEVDVRRPLHDEPGERDGVGDGGEARDGAAAQGGALHDARLHLDGAVGGEHGAPAGVEVRAVLQLPHLHATSPHTVRRPVGVGPGRT